MKKDKVLWVKIDCKNYYNLMIKLNDIGIILYDNKKQNNYILIKTTYNDYQKIKKYLVSYKSSIYSNSGFEKIKEVLKKYEVFSISVVIGIGLLFLANNMIFKVEIKSNNKDIQNLLIEELNKCGLGKMKLKKNHDKVEAIVDKILNDNKDLLEWLEVKYDGLVMIVNVVEKTKTEIKEEYSNCNIIAKTDAKITSLNIYRGVPLKEINDYVIKGDVILSGSIIHNEKLKNAVCASGEIYGEVWYKVKVEIPFQENFIKYTGKSRFNMNVKINDNRYQIFKNRIENKKEEIINLYKLNDFEINLIKEKEFVYKKKLLTEEQAYNKGINKALESIKLKLLDNEEILYKNVLKKEVNDSTIDLEIFIVTKENIGQLQIVEEELDNGIKSNT